MKRVGIVGGGIAGLSAAITMRRAGWQVSIHERAETFRPLGAALSLWPNAIAAFDRLGLAAAVFAAGAPLRSMLLADRRGRAILPHRPLAAPAVMISRAALHRVLFEALDGVDLVMGVSAMAVMPTNGAIAVRFDDGAERRFDLLIDAGGIRSTLAAPITGAADFRGYGGVLALTDAGDSLPLDGVATEYWGWGERFGLFELPDRRRYWFYMADQFADAPAPSHAHITERAREFPDAIAAAVAATSPAALVPVAIHAKPPPRALGRGRMICVGDAAHAMEPNLGQGACQAIEDAATLGALARDHSAADLLAAFEAVRLKRLRAIVRRAAEGRHGAHGLRIKQAAMRAFLRAVPPSITERVIASAQTLPDADARARPR